MSDSVVVKKLIKLREEINKLTKEYETIVGSIGHDIGECHYCKGRGMKEVFNGRDCLGDHYEDEFCYKCGGVGKILVKV